MQNESSNMSQTYKITGSDALRLAQRENLTVVDNDGVPTVTVTPTGWRDSKGNHCDSEGRTVEAYFNRYNGEYLGPDDDGVEPCWDDAPVREFDYATDAESGTVEAASLAKAYEGMRSRITDAQIEDGATLWVEDPATGERITMGKNGIR